MPVAQEALASQVVGTYGNHGNSIVLLRSGSNFTAGTMPMQKSCMHTCMYEASSGIVALRLGEISFDKSSWQHPGDMSLRRLNQPRRH